MTDQETGHNLRYPFGRQAFVTEYAQLAEQGRELDDMALVELMEADLSAARQLIKLCQSHKSPPVRLMVARQAEVLASYDPELAAAVLAESLHDRGLIKQSNGTSVTIGQVMSWRARELLGTLEGEAFAATVGIKGLEVVARAYRAATLPLDTVRT